MDPEKAYDMLYGEKLDIKKLKKARFVKLSIKIPDSKGVTLLLKTLFALPLPIILIRPFLRKAIESNQSLKDEFDTKELMNMISSKGIKIMVNASDGVKIKIKTM